MPLDLMEAQERKNKLATDMQAAMENAENWQPEDEKRFSEMETAYDLLVEEMRKEERNAAIAARKALLEETVNQQRSARRTEHQEFKRNRNHEVTEDHRCNLLQGMMRMMAGKDLRSNHEEAFSVCKLDRFNPNQEAELFWGSTVARDGLQMWHSQGRALPKPETRGLTVGTTTDGGHTVPVGFSDALEVSMLAWGGVRRVARIMPTGGGEDYRMPTMNDTGNTGELLAEEGAIGNTVNPAFGLVTMKAYKYSSKAVLVSSELLEDSAYNLAAELGSALGTRVGRITNTHFTTGDNSSKPQGVAAGSALGKTAASTTAITADEIIDLIHSVDPAYRQSPAAGLMFNDTTLSEIRKLKDGNSQYLWQPGMQLGVPDRIFGFPFTINQDVADTAVGAISVVFGDFSKYIIRDAASIRFYRLMELYRGTDQDGFILFSRHDGRILDSGTDPIKHIIQAAS